MTANEVLANIALELSGHKKGDYQIVIRMTPAMCRSRPTILIPQPSKSRSCCGMSLPLYVLPVSTRYNLRCNWTDCQMPPALKIE